MTNSHVLGESILTFEGAVTFHDGAEQLGVIGECWRLRARRDGPLSNRFWRGGIGGVIRADMLCERGI